MLDKINAGELDFATAAESYSKDTASAAEGGNVGWDRLSNLVTEYTTALADLNKGDVSGLVTSTYGIHIIQCTDVFEAPEELTSLDQLPTEFQDCSLPTSPMLITRGSRSSATLLTFRSTTCPRGCPTTSIWRTTPRRRPPRMARV